jgi:hypothetical protein
MVDLRSLVENSQRLCAHFEGWPSFHDAEVIDLHLWRGRLFPGDWDDRNVMPVLTAKILVLRATQKNLLGRNVEVTLRFHDFSELKLERFNHCNRLCGEGLTAELIPRGKRPSGEDLPPYLRVVFESGFGIDASFLCFRIEVLEAVECSGEEL